LRCDKLILSALQTTVDMHLAGESNQLLEMLQTPLEVLRARAENIVVGLKDTPLKVRVGEGKAQVGGGTLPRSAIPSVTLDITPAGGLAEFGARLRSGSPPVIGYISGGKFKIDLRSVFPSQDGVIVKALRG
jgi:L-seryl-tRNA(Ser) seleniumtransferase